MDSEREIYIWPKGHRIASPHDMIQMKGLVDFVKCFGKIVNCIQIESWIRLSYNTIDILKD